jgi:hypothetical protein
MLVAASRVVAFVCAMSVFGAAECAAKCSLEDCLQATPQTSHDGTSREGCHHGQGAPSKPHDDDQGKPCGHHLVATDRVEKAASKVVLASNDLLLQTPCLVAEHTELHSSTAITLIAESPPTLITYSLLTTNLRI